MEFSFGILRVSVSLWHQYLLRNLSEHKSRLQLKHARRIDIRERWNRLRSCADAADKLSKRGSRRRCVAVSRHAASKHVRVIEDVKAFKAQNDVTTLALEQALLDKKGDVRSRRALER